MKGIEACDDDVDANGAHEDDVTPEGHVAGDPEERRIASQLLLPLHLREHVLVPLKEVGHFRPLFWGKKLKNIKINSTETFSLSSIIKLN